MEVSGKRHDPAAVSTVKGPDTPCRVDPRACVVGYAEEKISRHPQDSNPDRQARSESLYRLSYRGLLILINYSDFILLP
jgi:hypothetical protein